MLSDAIYLNGPVNPHTDRYYFVSWHSLNNILDEKLEEDRSQVRVITVYKFDSARKSFGLYCMNHTSHKFSEYLAPKSVKSNPLSLNTLR